MTIDAKKRVVMEYCYGKNCKDGCVLKGGWEYPTQYGCLPIYGATEEELDEAISRINKEYGIIEQNIIPKLKEDEPSSVNHPRHYNRDDSIEAIDEMVLVFGKEAVMNFCLCNVWKYRYRASDKNGDEDLKKSDWYMRKYKELANE